MKERGILFSGPMVRAIIEGKKTQTRRVVKPQPWGPVLNVALGNNETFAWHRKGQHDPLLEGTHLFKRSERSQRLLIECCPYGVPGDEAKFGDRVPPKDGFYYVTWEPGDAERLVYLKRGDWKDEPEAAPTTEIDRWLWGETESDDPEWIGLDIADPKKIRWRAPGDRLWVRETFAQAGTGHVCYRADNGTLPGPNGCWTPAIHMPRILSRITLEVLSVRVERLQNITEEDAIAEGTPLARVQNARDDARGPILAGFANLWDTINGQRASWASNPWVWVVGFKVVTGGAK